MPTNPYEPPFQPPTSGFPATRVRPTSATVFGVLNLVFGILGICGSVFSAIVLFAPINLNPNVPNPVIDIMNQSPVYRVFNQVGLGLGFVATIVLIASGVGLLQLKSFGRTLAVGYGIYGILAAIVGLIVSVVFLFLPLMERMNNMPMGPERMGAMSGIIGGSFGGCIGLIYPVVLLTFMCRRNVVEAYRA